MARRESLADRESPADTVEQHGHLEKVVEPGRPQVLHAGLHDRHQDAVCIELGDRHAECAPYSTHAASKYVL